MASETSSLPSAVAAAERRLVVELGRFAVASAAAGGALWVWARRTGRGDLAGFGRQNLAWAGTDALIAALALARSRQPVADEDAAAHRALRLRRILVVNAVMDVGYIAGGVALARTARRRGDGWAIAANGLFLLWLDSRHARAVGRFNR